MELSIARAIKPRCHTCGGTGWIYALQGLEGMMARLHEVRLEYTCYVMADDPDEAEAIFDKDITATEVSLGADRTVSEASCVDQAWHDVIPSGDAGGRTCREILQQQREYDAAYAEATADDQRQITMELSG